MRGDTVINIFSLHDKKLRYKIANSVADKMYYLNTCPNERDTILRIIDPYRYKGQSEIHCNTDCNSHPDCKEKLKKMGLID